MFLAYLFIALSCGEGACIQGDKFYIRFHQIMFVEYPFVPEETYFQSKFTY